MTNTANRGYDAPRASQTVVLAATRNMCREYFMSTLAESVKKGWVILTSWIFASVTRCRDLREYVRSLGVSATVAAHNVASNVTAQNRGIDTAQEALHWWGPESLAS